MKKKNEEYKKYLSTLVEHILLDFGLFTSDNNTDVFHIKVNNSMLARAIKKNRKKIFDTGVKNIVCEFDKGYDNPHDFVISPGVAKYKPFDGINHEEPLMMAFSFVGVSS